MRRREFIGLLAGVAAVPSNLWPLAARAQQRARIPRISIIDDTPRWNAFRSALRELGYREGENIAFDYAYGDGVPERLAEAAAALVRRPVDVIATSGTPPSFRARRATPPKPILRFSVGDPGRAGRGKSLRLPAGKLTGRTTPRPAHRPK